MKALKALPRSRARTAWGLLQDVKKAMLAEPKRVHMAVYTDRIAPEYGGPACGTVGCFAGWVSILSGDPEGDDVTAKLILGEDVNYYTAGPRNVYVFNSGQGGDIPDSAEPQTARYARAVVARISKFMKVNQVALKKRRI